MCGAVQRKKLRTRANQWIEKHKWFEHFSEREPSKEQTHKMSEQQNEIKNGQQVDMTKTGQRQQRTTNNTKTTENQLGSGMRALKRSARQTTAKRTRTYNDWHALVLTVVVVLVLALVVVDDVVGVVCCLRFIVCCLLLVACWLVFTVICCALLVACWLLLVCLLRLLAFFVWLFVRLFAWLFVCVFASFVRSLVCCWFVVCCLLLLVSCFLFLVSCLFFLCLVSCLLLVS